MSSERRRPAEGALLQRGRPRQRPRLINANWEIRIYRETTDGITYNFCISDCFPCEVCGEDVTHRREARNGRLVLGYTRELRPRARSPEGVEDAWRLSEYNHLYETRFTYQIICTKPYCGYSSAITEVHTPFELVFELIILAHDNGSQEFTQRICTAISECSSLLLGEHSLRREIRPHVLEEFAFAEALPPGEPDQAGERSA